MLALALLGGGYVLYITREAPMTTVESTEAPELEGQVARDRRPIRLVEIEQDAAVANEPQSTSPPKSVPTPYDVEEFYKTFNSALALYNAGEYASAARKLSGRTEAEALDLAGISYYRMGDHHGAIASLERALVAYEAEGRSEEQDTILRLKQALTVSFYKTDNLRMSLKYADEVLALKEDPYIRGIRDRINREYTNTGGHLEESTEHFKVVFDGREHGAIDRMVLEMLEEAYIDVGRRIDHFPAESVTVVMSTTEQFRDITRAPSWAGAAYDGKIRLPVRDVDKFERSEVKRILTHEYVHALVHDLAPTCPTWVNEGLAEYLSLSSPRTDKQVGQAIPLNMIEQGFPTQGFAASVAYVESREAVAYLIDNHGMYRLKDLLVQLGRGSSFEQAFGYAMPLSYPDFLSTWGKKPGKS